MNKFDLLKERHSVRSYKSIEIEEEKINIINEYIDNININNGTNIQVFYNDFSCFKGFLAKYGKFNNVGNYISLTGRDAEKLGYYGMAICLKLQELGLNSCFVGLTHSKSKAVKNKGEKEFCLLSFGYGINSGVSHKIKSINDVSNYNDSMPLWFKEGVEAALLAPTAMNGQKFYITYCSDDDIKFKKGMGFYTKFDLGIVKYTFDFVTNKFSL